MASSYALPSIYQKEPAVSHMHSHSHHGGRVHNHSAARGGVPSPERKEALHGTGVAMQHEHPAHRRDDLLPDTSQHVLAELRTGILLVLPFILASLLACQSYIPLPSALPHDPLDLGQLKDEVLHPSTRASVASRSVAAAVEALTLTSAVILLVALLSRLFPTWSLRNRRAASSRGTNAARRGLGLLSRLLMTTTPTLALVLLYFAAIHIGGWRVGLALLTTLTAQSLGLARPNIKASLTHQTRHYWFFILLLVAGTIDFVTLAASAGSGIAVAGYTALSLGCLVVHLQSKRGHRHNASAASSQLGMQEKHSSPANHASEDSKTPTFLFDLDEQTISLAIVGLALSSLTIMLATASGLPPSLSPSSVVLRTASISAAVSAIYLVDTSKLNHSSRPVYYASTALCVCGMVLAEHATWMQASIELGISAILALAMVFRKSFDSRLGLSKGDYSTTTNIKQTESPGEPRASAFTQSLLRLCEPDSLMYNILIEKDSRRIAYFTCLNFAFMLVQGLYGYLSGSLGLLSDTVHMFFDCLGLIVGLGAAVASKWPPSPERPFGWGKLNTLAGFGNGIFLMLVSVEFAWEAIEGILDGHELRRVKELLVVSTLGLLINLVGLFAFGHAHAGHDHSHGHDHDHGHSHSHEPHDHHHEQDLSHSHQHAHHDHQVHGSSHAHAHDHAHDHAHNENMHGIFLHVAADAGGSLAVIISTALTLVRPWYLWDPLATIIIAALIFAAAIPLVQSSGRKLLLIVPDDKEHRIKNFLQEVSEIRGALGYASPRFWLSDGVDTHAQVHDHAGPRKSGDDGHEPRADLVGSVHVIAAPFADLEDLRERVEELAASKGIHATIQVEYENDGNRL